jgi:lysophospholipase L1-like esterase
MTTGIIISCSVLACVAAALTVSAGEELGIKAGEQIVAIGDSITQHGGYLRNMDAVFAKQYPALGIPAVINVGISGQKAENLIARFDKDVIQRKPAIVTLNIGINDVWHRLGQPHDENVLKAYKENVAKMVESAQAAGIRVMLCTPTVIGEDANSEGNKRLAMYVEAMKQIAAEKNCLLADLHAVFLQAVAGKPADAKGNAFTSDGVHMNDAGNWLMAEGILRRLGVPQEKIDASK